LPSSTMPAEPALTIGSIVRTSPSVNTSCCDGSYSFGTDGSS
jgi:hypothetical protein